MKKKHMSEDEMNKRENRPACRFTAVFPKRNGNNFPPPALVESALHAVKDMLNMLGFANVNIMIGRLGQVIEETPALDACLMDEERFEREAAEEKIVREAADVNEAAAPKVEKSKISVDEVMKGIDLTRTSEKGN